MPIEGPLRELGLADVFQLLDLSRKTGMLRVTAPPQLGDDEGVVYFDGGRVVQANLRSKPPAAIDPAALTVRELERKVRAHIQGVVYDLMSWDDGFFSFEERAITDVPAQARASIATESLLMESARRIDEWSRIAGKIPRLTLVPALAALPEDHETKLDLLPHEWEVLSLIDGERDVLAIAEALGRGEFETAKIVYGLMTTGVVEITNPFPDAAPDAAPAAGPDAAPAAAPADPEIQASLERGFAAVRAGSFSSAHAHLERFLVLAPGHPSADRAREALDALRTLIGAMDDAGHG